MDKMGTLRRTHYCGDITNEMVGQEVVVAGWIAKSRDLGGLIFADLRDTGGVLQLAFNDSTDKDVFAKAEALKAEYVVMAAGKLQKRESPNPEMPTGLVELFVSDLRILSEAQTPPFEVRDDLNVKDELRLRYRYLDLRREELHNAIKFRSRVCASVRNFFLQNQFVEIETPMMIKSTPEGARDYLVPSRVQAGRFYALPQSPQLYKQILMLSGYDKYFQIARCFRDEDLRADRQPEFTQIDMEMAFVDEKDVQDVMEGLAKAMFRDVMDTELKYDFPRMPWHEAMNRYGSDKPDTRFEMELCDISEIAESCGFGVFANAVKAGGSVRLINAKGLAEKMSRKEIDRLTDTAKTYGAKGLAYLRLSADGDTSSYEKFLSDEEKSAMRKAAGAETGDVLLVVADRDPVVFAALGALRLHIAHKYELINKGEYNFLWITDFPLFEYDDESGQYISMHHPFTMPHEDDIDKIETDPGVCRAKAYDLVVNGVELGSGSIRISNPELQSHMFKVLGFTEERAKESFGFLVEAYKYGAPPHGGMAFGLDRIVAIMLGKDSIRDVIAFPKVQNAGELMTGCPDNVDVKQLEELSIISTAKTAAENEDGK